VLPKPQYTLYVNSYDDKEKIVSSLTNNGYVVGAELEHEGFKSKGWRIDIYGKKDRHNEVVDARIKELESKIKIDGITSTSKSNDYICYL
jgi:hypothetical protein